MEDEAMLKIFVGEAVWRGNYSGASTMCNKIFGSCRVVDFWGGVL